MKKWTVKYFRVCCMLIITSSSQAQTGIENHRANKVNHQPVQLHYPDERVRKFVNFSFITYMLGIPATVNNANRNWGGVPTQVQFCYPYSLFRKKFPIAVGANLGISRTGFKDAQLIFSGNELINIAPDANIKRAVQRHWYAGVSALKTIRISQPLRVLAGPSFLLNFGGRLKQETKAGQHLQRVNTSQFIRRISVPLQIQVSYSKRQLASFGVWARIPTTPIFKGAAYKDLRQFQVGGLVALIF
jgi:hypothetical protein